jgi:transposase
MERLCRAQKTPVGLARRVQGMLLLHQGLTFVAAAKEAGLAERHLRKWAKRFKLDGLAGLYDKARPGRPPTFSP